jgi:hypothetical protein
MDDLKDRRGDSHLKEEALDRTMWRNRFGGGLAIGHTAGAHLFFECAVYASTCVTSSMVAAAAAANLSHNLTYKL